MKPCAGVVKRTQTTSYQAVFVKAYMYIRYLICIYQINGSNELIKKRKISVQHHILIIIFAFYFISNKGQAHNLCLV